ncbi:GNAT family acetyltransferase [Rhodanobacter thiooxydans]|uniref:GNAT family acetyltransferase n=1 Tax=Rhodanobacter thiooxydans TaxID=416169 RepID=A0A154QFZ9_9GAMM|nr:GNAT family protein [Rhodanobacter thiooxydans]EIM02024.1 acetyltransferase [Rhodanobacter thiooxydans LCS2]KZC23202.1 GNAT family acetyltransferase [Rhodanobacter thiooxydans]MCW0201998.1 GNAT family N-acetyltransferase [Rhodanobacter thiooxydans]
MELVTARLRIDALRPDDAAALFALRGDPAVARYQGWRPADSAAARAFIAAQPQLPSHGWFQRAIRPRDDGTLIGDLGLNLPEAAGDSVEFGISIAPARQGFGYADEAVRAVFDHVFGQLGRHRVHASVDPRNLACMALLRALGMRQEAHHRESLWLRGEWVDDAIFALLEHEWRAAQCHRG